MSSEEKILRDPVGISNLGILVPIKHLGILEVIWGNRNRYLGSLYNEWTERPQRNNPQKPILPFHGDPPSDQKGLDPLIQ